MDDAALIGRIYECTDGDGSDLAGLLRSLAEAFDAHVGHLLVLGPEDGAAENHFFGAEPAAFERYNDEFLSTDPRFLHALSQQGRVHSDVEAIDPQEFLRTALYNELLARYDIRFSLFTIAEMAPGVRLALSLMRPKARGHFGAAEKARLERLLPHQRRALALRRTLARMRDAAADLQAALDRLPVPVALVDEKGLVLCVSRRARAILDARDGLNLRDGRLVGRTPRITQAIAAAVRATAQLGEPVAHADLDPAAAPPAVRIDRACGTPLGLVFLPLGERQRQRIGDAPRARALVAFHDPRSIVRLNPALVARVHGLTPTEAELAAALAEGAAPAEIAAARGSSEHTVRTHIKRILEKTGTGRQVELVRLLIGGAALHLGGPDDR